MVNVNFPFEWLKSIKSLQHCHGRCLKKNVKFEHVELDVILQTISFGLWSIHLLLNNGTLLPLITYQDYCNSLTINVTLDEAFSMLDTAIYFCAKKMNSVLKHRH